MSTFKNPINQLEEIYLDSLDQETNDTQLLGRIIDYFSSQSLKWRKDHSLSAKKYILEFDGRTYILRTGKVRSGFNRVLHEGVIGFVLNGNPHFPRTYACEVYNIDGFDEVFHLSEYVEGLDLASFIRERNPSSKMMRRIFHQIIHAYYEVHLRYKFIHNDLHDENIIITSDGDIVIIDLEFSSLEISGLIDGVQKFTHPDFGPQINNWCGDLQSLVSGVSGRFDEFYLFQNLKDTLIHKTISLRSALLKSRDEQSDLREELQKLNDTLRTDHSIIQQLPKRDWVFKSYLGVLGDKLKECHSFDKFIDIADIILL